MKEKKQNNIKTKRIGKNETNMTNLNKRNINDILLKGTWWRSKK